MNVVTYSPYRKVLRMKIVDTNDICSLSCVDVFV
jgi:hypothetical protein